MRKSWTRVVSVAIVGLSLSVSGSVAVALPSEPSSPQGSPAAKTGGLRFQLLDEARGTVTVDSAGTVRQTIGRQQMTLKQDGSWSISDLSSTKSSPTTAAAFEVSGCAGSFADVKKVTNYIQFGATQTCTEGAYPHYIKYQLRSSTGGFLAGMRNETTVLKSSGLGYTRVANVIRTKTCKTSGNRKYQQIVWPAARGIEFGPTVDSEEPVVPCNLQ